MKMSHSGKVAKKKSVFMDSLDGSSYEDLSHLNSEGEEMTAKEIEIEQRREKWRLEKNLRNKVNREKNRAEREKVKSEMMVYTAKEFHGDMDQLTKFDDQRSANITKRDKYKQKNKVNDHSNHNKDHDNRKRKFDSHNNSYNSNSNSQSTATDNNQVMDRQEKAKLVEVVAQGGKDWKATGVHPSWAAKKLETKPLILPSQGKKITFDD